GRLCRDGNKPLVQPLWLPASGRRWAAAQRLLPWRRARTAARGAAKCPGQRRKRVWRSASRQRLPLEGVLGGGYEPQGRRRSGDRRVAPAPDAHTVSRDENPAPARAGRGQLRGAPRGKPLRVGAGGDRFEIGRAAWRER